MTVIGQLNIIFHHSMFCKFIKGQGSLFYNWSHPQQTFAINFWPSSFNNSSKRGITNGKQPKISEENKEKIYWGCFNYQTDFLDLKATRFEQAQWTITLNMADQGRSDSYVVFTISLYDTNFFVWWDMKLEFASHLQIALVSLCIKAI